MSKVHIQAIGKLQREIDRLKSLNTDLLEACKIALPLLKKHTCKYHGPMVCDKCYAVESLNDAIAKTERKE